MEFIPHDLWTVILFYVDAEDDSLDNFLAAYPESDRILFSKNYWVDRLRLYGYGEWNDDINIKGFDLFDLKIMYQRIQLFNAAAAGIKDNIIYGGSEMTLSCDVLLNLNLLKLVMNPQDVLLFKEESFKSYNSLNNPVSNTPIVPASVIFGGHFDKKEIIMYRLIFSDTKDVKWIESKASKEDMITFISKLLYYGVTLTDYSSGKPDDLLYSWFNEIGQTL